jgi:hypothetical protein
MTSPLMVVCPGCQKRFKLAATAAGKRLRCPACQTSFAASDAAAPELSGSPGKKAPTPAAAAPADFPRVEFKVTIGNDPRKKLNGTWKAKWKPDGLALTRGRNTVEVPLGTSMQLIPASFLFPNKGSGLEVELDGRTLDMRVTRRFSYQNRLAQDICEFFKGKRSGPDADGYRLALGWLVFVLLPLGIPALMFVLSKAVPEKMGQNLPLAMHSVTVWTGFAVALMATVFGLVQTDAHPAALRFLGAVGVAGFGYAAALILVFLPTHAGESDDDSSPRRTQVKNEEPVDPNAWNLFRPLRQSFEIKMPGKPKYSQETIEKVVGGGLYPVIFDIWVSESTVPQARWKVAASYPNPLGPNATSTPEDEEKLLATLAEAVAKKEGSTVQDTRKLDDGGTEVVIAHPDGTTLHIVRYYWHRQEGSRLFFAEVVSPTLKPGVRAIRDFFESFSRM